MLQINTGKLFSQGIGWTNHLTGVLYSNLRLPHDRDLVTKAGNLRGTGSGLADLALVYELEERIEEEGEGPGVLVSHTVGPYLDDFSVVASFGLGAVFSREPGTVRLLTDGRPSFGLSNSPEKFVSGFFDQTLHITDSKLDDFEIFVSELLALERKHFLGAMDSMRTFIGGLHRISDNLGQAYTMMVSAVESLAQGFDGFEPTWTDLAEQKRSPIDSALADIDDLAANNVREAILSQEHVALGRRYRQFVLAHLDEQFVRQKRKGGRPLASYELEPAIAQAYKLRSSYVHRLKSLPTSISHPHAHWETTVVDRVPALTFQGLYNVTDAVIRSFVARSAKAEREEYDYGLERAGVISMEMAPQYWVWKPIVRSSEARRRLEGLLGLTQQVFLKQPGAQLVDMRRALKDIENLLSQAKREHRPAMLLLHFLFNFLVAPNLRSDGFDQFFEKHREEAGQPSIESLVVATLLGGADNWSAETYEQCLDDYFSQRTRKSGFHAPRLFEAAMCLLLGEKYRQAGEHVKADQQIVRALEIDPDNEQLRHLNENPMPISINWREIVLPPQNETETGETKSRADPGKSVT